MTDLAAECHVLLIVGRTAATVAEIEPAPSDALRPPGGATQFAKHPWVATNAPPNSPPHGSEHPQVPVAIGRTIGEETEMPRYEIVAHVAQDLACDTPDEAAAVFRRRLLGGNEETVTLRHLAVWRLTTESAGWEVPAALRRQLVQFFTEVERCAAGAEEAFRARVESILAGESPPMEERTDRSGSRLAPGMGGLAAGAGPRSPKEPDAADRR